MLLPGDQAFISFVSGIQFMPMCLVALALCQPGQEGATFAVMTTFSNLGISVGSSIGNLFARFWDISNSSVKAHHYNGVLRLDILTSIVQLVPICWVCMMPTGREELGQMRGSSLRWGIFFLGLFVAALCGVVFDSVYELYDHP